MLKKVAILGILLVLLAFPMATVVRAATTKYTFNNVTINDRIVEIEASVKSTNNSGFSTCSYYSDDYLSYLGYYDEAVVAGTTSQEVLNFCVSHFDDRTP